MATNFPTSVDSFVNPTASDTLDSFAVPHASQHTNLNDAVLALENYALNDPWTSFTTASNFLNMTGTLTSEYYVRNDILYWRGRYAVTTLSSPPLILLPTGAQNNGAMNLYQINGHGKAWDINTGNGYDLYPTATGTFSTSYLYLYYSNNLLVNSNAPFTWASGDFIDFYWTFHI